MFRHVSGKRTEEVEGFIEMAMEKTILPFKPLPMVVENKKVNPRVVFTLYTSKYGQNS